MNIESRVFTYEINVLLHKAVKLVADVHSNEKIYLYSFLVRYSILFHLANYGRDFF